MASLIDKGFSISPSRRSIGCSAAGAKAVYLKDDSALEASPLPCSFPDVIEMLIFFPWSAEKYSVFRKKIPCSPF